MPVAAAPFGSQVRLGCSVIEGYGIFWGIILTSDPDIEFGTETLRQVQLLRSVGIEVVPSSSVTNSTLVINETEGSNGATITCIAFELDTISECRSRTSRVIFHGEYIMNNTINYALIHVFSTLLFHAGPPTIPFHLSVMENGFGSFNVSWSHTTIEGVAVDFTLTATIPNDSNADPIVVTGIKDLHQTLTVQDNTSCDVYSFRVTARNAAGSSSPSDSITSSFPILPAVEGSLEHSLRKADSGITLNVTVTVRRTVSVD